MIETTHPESVPVDNPLVDPSRTALAEMIDLWLVQTRNHPGPAAKDEDRHPR